jgi:hypothetical protein
MAGLQGDTAPACITAAYQLCWDAALDGKTSKKYGWVRYADAVHFKRRLLKRFYRTKLAIL